MTSPTESDRALSAQTLIARLERYQLPPWHVRARIIVATATFFDAFDVLALAAVLPVLVGRWHLSAQNTGLLISTGFAGQLAGALLCG